MIFNTTYKNKDAASAINNLLGNSYSFLQSIKMRGTGSKRMMIEEVSHGFLKFMNVISDVNYGNIELREKGIIIHINKGLKNYSWAIPYYQLHIYKTEGFSIHAQGNFVRFRNNKLLQENKKFLNRIIAFKIENQKQYDLY